jgi:hypothetical protein
VEDYMPNSKRLIKALKALKTLKSLKKAPLASPLITYILPVTNFPDLLRAPLKLQLTALPFTSPAPALSPLKKTKRQRRKKIKAIEEVIKLAAIVIIGGK